MRTVVLVVTFERFKDIWPIQRQALDKFWPGMNGFEERWAIGGGADLDCPAERKFWAPDLGSVQNWSELVLSATGRLSDCDGLFLVIGDHFLVGPVDQDVLARCQHMLENYPASCVRVWPSPGPDGPFPEDGLVGEIAQDAAYRISTSPAFFSVGYFRDVVQRSPPSAWTFELDGTRIAQNDGHLLLSVNRGHYPYPITLGLRNERWTPQSVEACRAAGLDIDASVGLRGVGP